MKAVAAALAAAAALTCWCGDVEAYRLFDGTDAAVAETGEMEIEFGPVEYLRQGPSVRCSLPISGSITASLQAGKQHSRVNSLMA
jgi:hypothetical protein